ncbi:unnamed protein product [Spodoptera exigua]|uniref:Uncharacterized protein n=1 Tax=Spodoptera exigua TaxID=7107 RepID=A0A922M485_SPOEX|nr:hypothetical protein HF086_017469 [Spodoptera exigua]CAH0696488.1 unnamed protein product [Spodoptera exigua]
MDIKLTIVFLVVLALMVSDPVSADFNYNHYRPKLNEVGKDNSVFKCVPGRTTLKMKERKLTLAGEDSNESDDYTRTVPRGRPQSVTRPKDETCLICVCSVDGQHEYCKSRSSDTLNECIMIKDINEEFRSLIPFVHSRNLLYRIRRDYLWHNDEIPYSPKDKCFRGHSYYSNSPTANDTDIDLASDVESLLDYNSANTCYYCVCAVDGQSVGCIHRDESFCNFFRVIRSEKRIRDRYTSLLEQDRPTYFRQLSWRLRRTMDNGIYDLINAGGDTLCCSHPDGHRRQIHNEVRNKLRTLKRRIPKENLLGGSMREDYVDFVVNND